jgi:peptide deformylase
MAGRRDDADEERRVRAQVQIRQFPDPVLKQRAHEVEAFDEDLAALVQRMFSLMDDAHGAGLAAPQIGLLRRLFVYQLGGEDADPVALVNPEIIETSEETEVDGEGCLSLALLIESGHQVPVERHLRIRVRATDAAGEGMEFDAEGHEARVIQHEIDHLDGTLILDRTTKESRQEAMRILRDALT